MEERRRRRDEHEQDHGHHELAFQHRADLVEHHGADDLDYAPDDHHDQELVGYALGHWGGAAVGSVWRERLDWGDSLRESVCLHKAGKS